MCAGVAHKGISPEREKENNSSFVAEINQRRILGFASVPPDRHVSYVSLLPRYCLDGEAFRESHAG